MSILGDIVGF